MKAGAIPAFFVPIFEAGLLAADYADYAD